MKMKKAITLTLLSLLFASSIQASDWPQFLGPDRTGYSSEADLNREWPESGPPILWSINVGEGFGAASIFKGRVYMLDREDNQSDVLRCFDLKSGEELWRFAYDAPGRLSYNGSRSTPTVTETSIYTVGPFGHASCFSQETKKLVWSKSLQTDFGATPPNWGFSQSPLLYEDMVIVAPMSDKHGLVALKKETGDIVWSTPSIKGDSYTSPALEILDGVEQVLMLTQGQLTSVNPQDGKILWTYDWYCKIPIPNPTRIDDNKLFVSGGYDAGSVLVQVSKENGSWSVKELNKIEKKGAQIHPIILHNDHLYANFNTNENLRRNPEGLTCLDLEGNIIWQRKDDPPIDRGAILIAGDLLLAMGGQDGVLHLMQIDPKGFKELASSKVFDLEKDRGNDIWGLMALSDGMLVVRSQNQMKCLKLK
ncbi:MAG: PQQ-like beta-propeller repeat protein [Candidatus Omnitrophica bacterium]|nr:PQQ-like beta-propeller repeat protein [Candidatus Omnitrophota bacterium]